MGSLGKGPEAWGPRRDGSAEGFANAPTVC